MFMSTLMTPQERGRRKTKLIKATDSPHHYGELSGENAVYFHCQFTAPPHSFNYHTFKKLFQYLLTNRKGEMAGPILDHVSSAGPYHFCELSEHASEGHLSFSYFLSTTCMY